MREIKLILTTIGRRKYKQTKIGSLSLTLDIELQGKSVINVCSHWTEIDVCVAGPEVERVADAVLGGDELVAAAVDEIVTSWNSR